MSKSSDHDRDRQGTGARATAEDDINADASRSSGGRSRDEAIAEIERWAGISSTELTPSPDARSDFDQVSRHGIPADPRGVAAVEAEHALGKPATGLARSATQNVGDAADAGSSQRRSGPAPGHLAHEAKLKSGAVFPAGSAPGSSVTAVDAPVAGNSRPGFIDNDDGSNIRSRPAELDGSKTLTDAPLPSATRVFVSGHHPQSADWWYVTAFLPDAIVRGYVQGLRVTTDLPEPTAKLYQVKSGDTAEKLAAQEFASAVRDGHDLRYYENVLLFVNQTHGRAGVRGSYQDPGLLGGGSNNVQLEAGRRIWLVSPAYARAVEGVIPSGSLTGGAVAKAKRFASHIEDLVKSVTESPSHLGEVAGEYAQAIRDHMAEIVGIMAGFVMAEAASAFLAATPTGVGQIAAVAIQLGLAAFGAVGMVEAGVQAPQHAQRWLIQAWNARGNAEDIAAASAEFVKLLVALAMAALSYLGIKGNVGNAAALARSMPGQLPAFAVVGGQTAEAGGAAAATGMPGPAGPLGTTMAMSTPKDSGRRSGSSGEDATPENEAAREPHGGEATKQERVPVEAAHPPANEATLKPPASRHRAASVSQATVAKKINTVYEPTVDVTGDVAAIRAGKAVRRNGNYEINGRTYGIHDGTLYPISGPGFHVLNRGAFQALGVLNRFGNTPEAHAILAKMINVSTAETEAALAVWRLLQ